MLLNYSIPRWVLPNEKFFFQEFCRTVDHECIELGLYSNLSPPPSEILYSETMKSKPTLEFNNAIGNDGLAMGSHAILVVLKKLTSNCPIQQKPNRQKQ